MEVQNPTPEDPNLMLFVNVRPSRAHEMFAPEGLGEVLAVREAEWARRAGIENAPFRRTAKDRTDFSTDFNTTTHQGQVVTDVKSPDYAESEYATPVTGHPPVRDRHSGD